MSKTISIKQSSDTLTLKKKNSSMHGNESNPGISESKDPLDTVAELNEPVENFERPQEIGEYVEISPRIFGLKNVLEPLTIPSLNNAIYELGIVNLCWPKIIDPVFENRKCFPKSYYTNDTKERLLLAYCENFRRQFLFHHKFRKPLLLQCPNECGLQKMVCTTLRPTKLCFADTNHWKGIAQLVSDYFVYEPLTKPMLHPERLMSPYTCIVRRSGNPFEICHVCVSWLIGAGYDAYVVVGCAPRDTCMNIRYRTACPDVPDETEVIVETPPPEEEPRYRLVPLPDFTSKYQAHMAKKEADKVQAELDKIEAKRQQKIDELELPPEDKIDEWRTHAWVLILPGPMEVEKPFFIEPSEGNPYGLDTKKYQHIESIYNHENYYVNLQDNVEGMSSIDYDVTNIACWEHLLPGEPYTRRTMIGIDTSDKSSAVDTEKHLDMPQSWVEKLDISTDDYDQRYPGFTKRIHYKKVLVDKFARYSQRDGIVKRVRVYDDYALQKPLLTYEWYENRADKMETVRIDHVKREVREVFIKGRKDHILKHSYSLDAPAQSVEGVRTLEFNYYARLDHLTKLQCTPVTFDEYYTDREDRLETRMITYTEPTKIDTKRMVKDIVETYGRNDAIPAKLDVWKKLYHIQDFTMELLYHYAYNFVTNDTRFFTKPNLAEAGGKILYFPDKNTGYIADPCAKPSRPLDIYYSLCNEIELEYQSNKHVRERETDVNGYLKHRYNELKDPKLVVALFDTERNEEAKKGWREQEAIKAQILDREKDAGIDPLAPYLARMFGSGHGIEKPLTLKEATLVREQCINDFKAKQLARQHLVQERFDKINAEYKAKRLWYLANQYILSPEKEAAYFVQSAELAFSVHTLEVRLSRHRDLSGARFRCLVEHLDAHALLVEYNRTKHHARRTSLK